MIVNNSHYLYKSFNRPLRWGEEGWRFAGDEAIYQEEKSDKPVVVVGNLND